MHIASLRHAGITAAFIASGWVCASAGAQSLALSYKLDPIQSAASLTPTPVVDRCAGLSWAASLAAACIPDGLKRVFAPMLGEPVFTGASSVAAASGRLHGFVAALAAEGPLYAIELPVLGSPTDERLMRLASDTEVAAASKSGDPLFRFASKYRLGDRLGGIGETWSAYKFKDVTSENRTQATGVKAFAVELLFPFQ